MQLAKLGAPLNSSLDKRQGRQPGAGLGDLEHRAAELAGLGLWLFFALPFLAASVACWVAPGAAVFSVSVPCSALITAPLGILLKLRQRHELAIDLDQHQAGRRHVNDLPSAGCGGAAALVVVNVTSGPNVVPALLVATSRT